jgi:hypothetical protein
MSHKRQIWALFAFQFRSLKRYCNHSGELEVNLFSFVDLPTAIEYPQIVSSGGVESTGVSLTAYRKRAAKSF